MHHGDRPVQGDHGIQALAVEDVTPFERSPMDEGLMPVRQVIVDDGHEAGLMQGQTGVRPDITGAAR